MRRILWLLFWLLELPLLVVAALLLLLWVWSGTDQSLASALNLASRYLPAGQTLATQDVTGSLRRGGHVGSLRWEQNGLVIHARNVDLSWQPVGLLSRRLQLDRLHIAELGIADRSAATPAGAPLREIVLPVEVDLNFGIDRLLWSGPPAFEAGVLAGHYRYDGQRHSLQLDSAHIAAGVYSARGTLQARSPMALELQLQGKVQAPLGERSIALDAVASLQGPLAAPDALLDLRGRIAPASAGAAGMGATVAAQVNPWAPQPLRQARSDFKQFNLALLFPDAPQTLLSGHASVEPQGNGWQARLDAANTLAGPWDTGRLPVESAKASVGYAYDRWSIQSLDATAAGGQIKAQARLGQAASIGPLSGWQGQAQLQGIDPSRLYSTLAPARLDGALKAEADKGAVVFDVALKPAGAQPAASPLQGLRLQSAAAKGRWAAGWLELQTLDIQTDDARLHGQASLQPATRAARANVTLAMPGASAKVSGQLGALDGAGDFSLQLADAAQATRWMGRLPYLPAELAQINLQGSANAELHWQGGWQAFLRGGGAEPSVQLKLQAPQLAWADKGQTAVQARQLRDFQAELSGPLSALALKTQGNLQQGSLRAQLQAQASGGRTASGAWQATLGLLRMQAQDSLRPGPWTLALRQPVRLDWQPAPTGGSLQASASEADLAGPVPGTATLVWQPVRWTYGTRNEIVSKGQLRSLDMSWLELVGGTPLAALGLSGNMVFDADWDLAATDTLKLRAALVRRSGDIRVLADSAPAGGGSMAGRPVIQAGVKDARVTLEADGGQLRLAVVWDSERAGSAQAELATRVTHNAEGWSWAPDSPLRGTVRARLPQVGAWSVLAPPGWRMRGTLDANLAVSGTRQAPQWNGSLQADDLALRSVVDGIEFSNGRLRTSVQGQRLTITEFSLQGAGGAAGGELTATGFALWLPDGTGQNPALSKVRIELDAAAKALRLSSRADRRLTVSGAMQARLDNAGLSIRGALKADQALFILPDETAPSLGSDVVVKRPADSEAAVRPVSATVPEKEAAAGTRVATDLLLTLDLGPDFQLQGRGINTRLAGSLQLRSNADTGNGPRLTGEVRTVRGIYKAYGQNLNIETGVLRFQGPYDNPSLEILAIRPNLTQRVGVQITGNALAPRVRLYSEPELAEAEKLSWLVLGRSGANGGAEAAVLQQAAMALLGGSKGASGGLASSLGLDELSFSGSTTNADGTTTSRAAVTLGKRLSQNFYVAYERSLAGTLGTFSIFYDLSQRFTLRARTGEQSAVDLIFTYSYE